ncbi:class I SAM-dependent methyltransferase [Rhodoferax sp.]|uniref:class I SAM-dependent methyltransferase n=1 Tax=Rhodoferax sp. TaxID=50421 RepID=UPI00374DD908
MSKNYLGGKFWGVANPSEFIRGIQHSVNNLKNQVGIFTGDQLFTFNRNLSFMDDEAFVSSMEKNAVDEVERGIIWRSSVLLWGIRNGLRLEGDFVECGCYKGTSVRVVCDAIDFAKVDKQYFLYDMFEHNDSMPHHAMPEHSAQLYQDVTERFADMPNVVVTQGRIPDVLEHVAPEKIAFMHIDMNNAEAEVSALEVLFDRMVPGALLVLDDYGWAAYAEQKQAEDAWLATRGYRVLELPTGQGLVIK